jgi:hypothetical protein
VGEFKSAVKGKKVKSEVEGFDTLFKNNFSQLI